MNYYDKEIDYHEGHCPKIHEEAVIYLLWAILREVILVSGYLRGKD